MATKDKDKDKETTRDDEETSRRTRRAVLRDLNVNRIDEGRTLYFYITPN